MNIVAVDPGPAKSAWVYLKDGLPVRWAWEENIEVKDRLRDYWLNSLARHLAIEYMVPRGMPMSAAEMDTQFEAGRLVEAWQGPFRKVTRNEVKMFICGSPRANDGNIKKAIIDLYGGKEQAIGGVKCPKCKGKGWIGRGRPPCPECAEGSQWSAGTAVDPPIGTGFAVPPGPLHAFDHAGMGTHGWSALGVALTAQEQLEQESRQF